jgi:two-component system, response regulator
MEQSKAAGNGAADSGLDRTLILLHVNDSTSDQVIFQAACRAARVPITWHVADSAAKGITYLRTLVDHSKAHEVCWPDLILLDIVMPVENGFSVLKYIRSTPELQRTPVVIFTGFDREEWREEATRLGASSFLIKPSKFEETIRIARALYDAWIHTPPPDIKN